MHSRRLLATAIVAGAVGLVGGNLLPATAALADDPGTFTNPVTAGYTADFPDPSVILGKDGWYYAYSTGGPLSQGDPSTIDLKMARSLDLVHWQGMGSAITSSNKPTYGSGPYWAPDVRYLNGSYLMYYVVPDTNASADTYDPAIGVMTAPSPAGPWTDSGSPVVAPQKLADGSWQSIIDPAEFTDNSGQQYLYYGGFNGGIWVVPLSADGRSSTGPAIHLTSNRFEAPYVMHRNGYYYLFASSAFCCAGPTFGYSVFVGRSTSPIGPFTDANGRSLLTSRSGGTIVQAPNGDKIVGTGHNAVVEDRAGQDWIVSVGVDTTQPYLQLNNYPLRPMVMDRLDWINGWPITRAGAGVSAGPITAPVAHGSSWQLFDGGNPFNQISGTLTTSGTNPGSDSGNFALLDGNPTLASDPTSFSADTHVEADVRVPSGHSGRIGLVSRYEDADDYVRAYLDTSAETLSIDTVVHGVATTTSSPVPSGMDSSVWQTLTLDTRGSVATASLDGARLGDPWASVTASLPVGLSAAGSVGVYGVGEDVEMDNYAANDLFQPPISLAANPAIGAEITTSSDEFNADGIGSRWSWVRKDDSATEGGGVLSWPTETADLNTSGTPTASALLESPPSGPYILETKVNIDLGVDTIRDFQQAGLIVYVDDTHWLRFSVSAHSSTRTTEFSKNDVIDGVESWGSGVVGPPGATTWLRLAHWTDGSGKQYYRAGSSDDGATWYWGLTYTLPSGSQPKIGLVSQGSTAAATATYGPALATFDYFRLYGYANPPANAVSGGGSGDGEGSGSTNPPSGHTGGQPAKSSGGSSGGVHSAVDAARMTPSTTHLAHTGSDVSMFVAGAGLAVVIGALLLIRARSRRRSA